MHTLKLFTSLVLLSLPLVSYADYVYTYTNTFSQEYDPESVIGPSFTITVDSPTLVPPGVGVYPTFVSSLEAGSIICAGAICETGSVPALEQGFYSVGENRLPATWLFLLSFGSTTASLGDYGITQPPQTCGGMAVNSAFFDCVQTSETLANGAKVEAYGLTTTPGEWSVTAVPLSASAWFMVSGIMGLGIFARCRPFRSMGVQAVT
jgi:hypothetical protein